MTMKLRDETGSLLISALVFLMVISLFLTGLGLIIKNESRQQQLLKNNYIAKSMIQLSYNDFTSRELTESSKATYDFNHGKVKVKFLDETTIEFNVTLQNNYQFSRQMYISLATEEEELGENLEEESLEDVKEDDGDQDEDDLEKVDNTNENTQESNEIDSGDDSEQEESDEPILENIKDDDKNKVSNSSD